MAGSSFELMVFERLVREEVMEAGVEERGYCNIATYAGGRD